MKLNTTGDFVLNHADIFTCTASFGEEEVFNMPKEASHIVNERKEMKF